MLASGQTGDPIAEYTGDEKTIALQKSLRARAAEMRNNPLIANGGRIANLLDTDAYGWDRIRA